MFAEELKPGMSFQFRSTTKDVNFYVVFYTGSCIEALLHCRVDYFGCSVVLYYNLEKKIIFTGIVAQLIYYIYNKDYINIIFWGF